MTTTTRPAGLPAAQYTPDHGTHIYTHDAGADYCVTHQVTTYPGELCVQTHHAGPGSCPGEFTPLERLPAASVFACAACGQHRVVQDDPDGHRAAMAALAAGLLTAAGMSEDVEICGCTNEQLEAGQTCGQDQCPNLIMAWGREDVERYADDVIAMIREDMAYPAPGFKVIPHTVASFSELHDYRDANMWLIDAVDAPLIDDPCDCDMSALVPSLYETTTVVRDGVTTQTAVMLPDHTAACFTRTGQYDAQMDAWNNLVNAVSDEVDARIKAGWLQGC